MVPNIQVDDKLRADLPPKDLLNHWLEISNQNSPNVELDIDEWHTKAYIYLQVVELAQKLYECLEPLPLDLGIPESAGLRSSITIPLIDGSMATFVSRDSRTGYFFSETFSQFQWGKNPKSIAGICATKKEPILIPDLDDETHPLRSYWIPSAPFNEDGGVLAVPMVAVLRHGNHVQKDCVAVLSITVTERGILNDTHLSIMTKFAQEITPILIQSTILHSTEELKQKVLERLFSKSSLQDELSKDSRYRDGTPKRILAELISSLRAGTYPGRKATKAIALLRVFQVFGDGGIALPNLFHFFEGTANKARRVASEIANINNRYLKDRGIQIYGTTVYRVGPIKRGKK